jgi:hypothetical protein
MCDLIIIKRISTSEEIKVLEWCYSNKDLCDDSEIEEREDFINELERIIQEVI